MADMGGFDVTTPQDLFDAAQQNRQKVFSSGNVQQQRSYNIENALDSLFGNPQQRQAAQVQSRIQSAMKQVQEQKPEGESDLDYELRRLQTVRDAIVDKDPAAASQINAQMLKLGQMKFERGRLMAADNRAAESHTAEMAANKDAASLRAATGGLTYVYNKANGTAESFDVLDPAASDKFRKAASQPGVLVLSPAQAYDLYHDTTLEGMKVRQALAQADGSKVTAQKVEQVSSGLLEQYATADRMLQVLEANPDVLSAASAGAQKFDQVANELAATGRALNGGKTTEGQSIDSYLDANGITNPRAKSLTIALAAAQAKANNPDGRISNQDMSLALGQVGGNNPNPAVLMANLNDTLTRSHNALHDRLTTLDDATQAKFAKRSALLDQKFADFTSRFQKYATGLKGPAATGIATAPDKDGWTTINGVRIREKK